MKEQSIETFLDHLVQVLVKDLGFYIPKSIFPEIVLEKMGFDFPEHFFDELFYLDLKNGMMFFDNNLFMEKLAEKPRLFESNIIQLLQKRDELGEAAFDYILEKYFDKVNFYCKAVSLLSGKLGFYFKDTVDFSVKGSFEIQFNIYKSHLLELISRFYKEKEVVVKEHYDYDELLLTYLPDFTSRLGIYYKELTTESETEFPNSNNQNDNKIAESETPKSDAFSKKRVKKEPLLLDAEVEDFILTTVFNMKLDSK
ncbi:hypothetical protein [Flavobacterium cellulosilyticum]|uniref:Uncharacterized protein n=1 Tax=Flavobacterium cellulosilyticum TaxID=2541731 RepID=A0A4R5C827_9FLAO|nr:hypothetical protein [Flavobacterium cellulosilyticum]TDD94270.1 hypothetical protein E0F76_16845 [Flavobacterium cellulosilyticum]